MIALTNHCTKYFYSYNAQKIECAALVACDRSIETMYMTFTLDV